MVFHKQNVVTFKDFIEKFLRKFDLFLFTRKTIEEVKTLNKKDLIGVEIGVGIGTNAKNILMNLSIKKLYLIDHYDKYSQNGVINNDSYTFGLAKKLLRNWEDKIIFIKKLSQDAINDVPNELDFVYIDGNHDYEFVKKDIEMYYPKVRSGGIIGGHDFDGFYPDVCKAVIEFCDKNNIKLHSWSNDWWVVKK